MQRLGHRETYLESPPVAKELLQTRRIAGTRRTAKYCSVLASFWGGVGGGCFNALFVEIK